MQEAQFLQELKEIKLLQQALYILEWDAQTGMPQKASTERSEVTAFLYEQYFAKKTGTTVKAAINYFKDHESELSAEGQAAYQLVKEEYELNENVPKELMAQYAKATSFNNTLE